MKTKDKITEIKVDRSKIEEGLRLGKLIPFDRVLNELSEEDKKKVDAIEQYYTALINLRELRKKKGITQEELSRKSGVARDAISKIESGKRNVTISTLINIASAMGKKVEIKLV